MELQDIDLKELIEIETWKDIKGYEGYYQVSSIGKIRSIDRKIVYSDGRVFNYHGKEIKTQLNKGYEYIKISKNSCVKTFKVHRLVAQAFVPNPLNLPQVNHKDENKINNRVDNLEWCTGKYNMNYGTVMQRVVNNTNHKLIAEKLKNRNGKKLYQYSSEGKLIKVYPSIHEAVRNGFDKGAIGRCIRKKVNMHRGFVFSLEKFEA